MFLLRAFVPNNHFWKYAIGFLVVLIASTIGQIPLALAVLLKTMSEGKNFPTEQNEMMSVLDKNLTLFLLLISFAAVLLAIFLVVRYLHNQKFIDVVTSRPKIDWKRFFFAFVLWGLLQLISVGISYMTTPEDYTWNFNLVPFLILSVIAILLIPIQTSAEELFFRGYLMQGFALLTKNKWFPLLITSISFGLLHLANPEVEKMGYITMVYYIGTGLFLGICALMDEGLELSLGFHAANNLITALLVTSDWTAFQTDSMLKDVSEPSAGFEIVFPVLVIFPILLFIFSKKYNWTNWKEKLTGKLSPISVENNPNEPNHAS
jgi:uncharacterized protein